MLTTLLFLAVMLSVAGSDETGDTNIRFASAPGTRLRRTISVSASSPERIQTNFLLYTRKSNQPDSLDARYPEQIFNAWTHFTNGSKTIFIIHGFMDTVETQMWMKEMADELLKNGDYNVVIVDWSGGNQIDYLKAKANRKIVGAQIAQLINFLIRSGTLTAAGFHLIGHSLGAHTAGFAGQRVAGLGRISGLDPAGPGFDGLDASERLDATDAVFVDVIHSNIKTSVLPGFGFVPPCGHVDFYPNGGYNQPGCPSSFGQHISSFFNTGLIDTLNCDHLRAFMFFTESINSRCPFLAFPCATESDFQNNKCYTCGNVGCSSMGFHADKNKPTGGRSVIYYLRTGPSTPFCHYQYIVHIKFSNGIWKSVTGTATVHFKGSINESPLFTLNGGKSTTFFAGQTSTFPVDIAEDIRDIRSVTFKWTASASWLRTTKSVSLEYIQIYRPEVDRSFKFCSQGEMIPAGGQVTLSVSC